MSDSEEDRIDTPSEGGDDLFGDVDDAPASDRDQPQSEGAADSDAEMAQREYGDEEGDEGEIHHQTKTRMIQRLKIFRHGTPKPADGALKVLRVPPFISFHPIEYDPETFEPTQFDLDNSKEKHPKPVVRFRKNPDTDELESNAVMYKWSDGSTTICVGEEHYEMQTKGLAPAANKPYQELQDSHYYFAAASISNNLLHVVGHITEQYTVRPNKKFEDAALLLLQSRLEAAQRSSQAEGDMMIRTTQDPELMKKQAELAEKERERARRRRENAAARLDGTQPRYQRGGLSLNDLEGAAGRRKGGKRGAAGTGPRTKRRRDEYDSDDDLPQGQGRQEDYDHEDAFIAPSDEEPSEAEEDDEDELEEDYDEEERPRAKKRQKPSRGAADADMSDDNVVAAADARRGHGRRRVIDEDEDDE